MKKETRKQHAERHITRLKQLMKDYPYDEQYPDWEHYLLLYEWILSKELQKEKK